MVYPPLWMWLLAFGFIFVGLVLSCVQSVDQLLSRLPGKFCALLVLAGLVGMWYLLNVQFSGLVFQIRLP